MATTEVKTIKRTLTGKVTSISGDKTIKVRVEIKYPHKKYGKIIKEHKNYLVNNPENKTFEIGQTVNIKSIRPVSKRKSWEVTD